MFLGGRRHTGTVLRDRRGLLEERQSLEQKLGRFR